MPPPRRRPASPPTRRPKVAGLHRRTEQPEEEAVEATPELDAPAIREDEPKPAESNGRPRPSAKRRDSGTVVSDEPAPPKHREQDPEPLLPEPPDAPDEEAEPSAPLNLTLPIVLVVVALLLGGLGFWFTLKQSDARVGSGNTALVDVNGTKDLVGAAQEAVTGVLSYKFDDMPNATARAKGYLDGEAVGQYEQSMKALEKEIQEQKLQVVVNPVSVGVVRMSGDDARVLVFADQIGTRADKQPSGGPTQFAMDMHRTGGKWKIVKLDFFETK